MPSFTSTNVAQIETVFTSHGSICENIRYAYNAAGWTYGTLYALATALQSDWETNGLQFQGPDTSLLKVVCTDLTSGSSSTAFQLGTPGNHGTLGTTQAPNNVTLAIQKWTGLRGRANRGRVYWVGISNQSTTGDLYDQTVADNIANFLSAQLGLINTTSAAEEVIITRGTGSTTVVVQYLVTNYALDSQRRRLFGRGA